MAWIEAHQNLPLHPKTKRLARLLNISIREAVGSLYMFWWWAMEYAKDGDLSNFDAQDIADSVQWDSDPEEFLSAMINCGPGEKAGFIDKTEDGMFIHDWQEYGGHYLEIREKNRKRLEKYRSKKTETGTESVCNANEMRTENVRNANGTGTKRDNITRHDMTQHNLHDMTEHDTTATTTPTHRPADVVSLNEVIEAWNQILAPQGFPSILKKTPAREKALNARINVLAERKKIEWWQSLFTRIASSDFLKNSAKEKTWFSFEWILNENNLVKVLEGKYDNRVMPTQPPILSFDEILAKHATQNANSATIDAEFEVKSND